MYYSIKTIVPSPAGFDEYQVLPGDEEIYDISDILNEIDGDIYNLEELEEDEIPDEIEDIRGNIYNEPNIIFAVVDYQGVVSYFGLDPADD